ncbi:MAG TPA: HAMP domain-containing sensor histidine kinase [Cyclobacteriaceae bacterium]|nr:HAMP domain-containing sensor histidine kinase [Cyclobacteriaceae bacterium]
MTLSWLIVLGILLLIAVSFLIYFYLTMRTQKILLRVQSNEIEKQIRELNLQNQKQAALNREKQQLIMLVSHDLKGPFNRIYALTQLLEMGANNLTDEQKEYLNKMYHIIGDGLNMVRNIVDVRKIEEKGADPYPEKLNLPSVILPIIKQYSVLAEKKKIKVNYQTPEKIEMTSDKNYICRVMENLLSNALKFTMPGKEVFVTVKSHGDHVEIAVTDQGPGLNADDLANLYQKFKKLTPRPTGGETSQGLGLSIVKILTTCMGGEVVCKSELEVGSTFTVTLPNQLKKSIEETQLNK